jgi:hypothetical protein
MPTPKKAPPAPALLYPAHGCPPLGTLTEAELTAQMRQRRQSIREHWNQPPVKAIIELLEMRAALTTRRAISPDASPHDQGQAYALTDFLSTLTQIPATSEIA